MHGPSGISIGDTLERAHTAVRGREPFDGPCRTRPISATSRGCCSVRPSDGDASPVRFVPGTLDDGSITLDDDSITLDDDSITLDDGSITFGDDSITLDDYQSASRTSAQ